MFLIKQASIDGNSLNQIVSSQTNRELFAKNGWKIPQSPQTLKTMIIKWIEKVKELIKEDLTAAKVNGNFFSISIDEWTSVANIRYMNVFLTLPDKSYNLGVIELKGSMTAENLKYHLEKKLEEFCLELNSLVGITSDGASVMLKLQSSCQCLTQICIAHGFHLSVKDTLLSDDRLEFQTESDCCEDDDDDNGIMYITKYNDAIKKMTKIINTFSHSALLQEKLKEYRESEGKSKLQFIKAVKTRWNSLYLAIERFIILHPQVMKISIDIQSKVFNVSFYKFLCFQV